jgi:predicted RNase H-like HicB family nuclease
MVVVAEALPYVDESFHGSQYTSMFLTAVLIPAEEGGFVAMNPETGTTTQGETIPEAISNLREATALYLEEFPLESAGQPIVTTFEVPANA